MAEQDVNAKGNWISRFWRFLWVSPARYSLGAILVVGFALGLVFVGGGNYALEHTGTEEFCVSCHEMGQPLAELKKTAHYSNRTGMRAICADCHIPHALTEKIPAKVVTGGKDIIAHFNGVIDTTEKFEAKRLAMAVSVWRSMKDRDSKECRGCHQNVWNDTENQFGGAARHHEIAANSPSMTCIDCHQGIAHDVPKELKRPVLEKPEADNETWLTELEASLKDRH